MKTTIQIKEMKKNKEKITMVTAYDYPSAKLAEQAEVDMLLVGDSLGMVVLGYKSTIEVTVEDMIHHGMAVTRGAKDTFVVIDMPFMSYHISTENSLENARRIIQKTNAHAVKVEGAAQHILDLTERLTVAGVPVFGHLGLTPQSVHVLGGYRVQGKNRETAKQLIIDAKNLERAGAIGIVLECVPDLLAKYISEQLTIPTIGIGAGMDCDGQVLVYHDILQYAVEYTPSFVQKYEEIGNRTKEAIKKYCSDVKTGQFPTNSHKFSMEPSLMKEIIQEENQ
ncbi:3-methyl-2-oxobutanoate hydroxymethyltransferase [Gracilibacillus oryzae]|uniref:3-methyl-2-oxobutanoate hydroxymethyltransferase n=1 Tax=Gracilibacillus oryzae TaxID=1672701 RepID=A0A7C8GUP4_9BACI|nr:3-methyl-2-oxobutanoate hydroxymethyltransferase [Gracilibacillus oryzae]KAB8138461.1 3-methyl-2-oxobutanoate hydroxymethyltransferase [Gracilibacillus oryzae]